MCRQLPTRQFRRRLLGGTASVCLVPRANFLVNAKQSLENNRPGVAIPDFLRRFKAYSLQLSASRALDHVRQRASRILPRPVFLPAENNAIHIAAANADHWRAAGLTLQCR